MKIPDKLQHVIHENLCEGYRLLSRIHLLHTISNETVRCFIKRDDELSFSISGSKLRKYLTLIPHLKKNQIQNVLLIGGAFSNHVVGLTQLLIENGMKPILFLRKAANETIQGNRLFLELLIPREEIHWIARTEWPKVEEIANAYAKQREALGEKTIVIPEGACMEETLLGAMTLALDIVRNQHEHQLQFDHLFVDAGTGMQAIALILGLSFLDHSGQVNVILLADDEKLFKQKLSRFHSFFEMIMEKKIPFPQNYLLHRPTNANSFGSVNKKVIEKIYEAARFEGIFLDPIYTAKLFIEGERIIKMNHIKGNVLFIHSGGAMTLTGYAEQLIKKKSENERRL